MLIFLLFSKDDRSRSLSICDTLSTVVTIVMFNKTCNPTLDHFRLVNVLAQVWVPDVAGIFKFRSYERNVG